MLRRWLVALFLFAICCIECLRLPGFAKCGNQPRAVRPLYYRKWRSPSRIKLSDTADSNSVVQENSVDESITYTNETLRATGCLDPAQQALIDEEKTLQAELAAVNADLRSTRQQLSKLRDRVSESGRNGFFIVQAQVNDFARRKDAEQKKRVSQNKREFVSKMLPWVDEFRSVPVALPAETAKGKSMHDSFGALLQSVLTVFGKYGYKEYTPEVGDLLDANIHEVVKIEDMVERPEYEEDAGSGLENTVCGIVRAGMRSADGDVLRKARVVVYGERPKPSVTTGQPPPTGTEECEATASSPDVGTGEDTADRDE